MSRLLRKPHSRKSHITCLVMDFVAYRWICRVCVLMTPVYRKDYFGAAHLYLCSNVDQLRAGRHLVWSEDVMGWEVIRHKSAKLPSPAGGAEVCWFIGQAGLARGRTRNTPWSPHGVPDMASIWLVKYTNSPPHFPSLLQCPYFMFWSDIWLTVWEALGTSYGGPLELCLEFVLGAFWGVFPILVL